MLKLNLVSSPRNRSTLLMYSFAQRSDIEVVDEPFYAHYFKWSKTEHPGRDEVLKDQSSNIKLVQDKLLENNSPVLFIKNMAHHYREDDFKYLLDLTNILYIRDPRAIIRSYNRVIEKPSSKDVGIQQVKRIYDYLVAHGKKTIILDSDDLIANPAKVLSALCKELKISFENDMLGWQAGPKPYDGCWAKHWYASVHQSTGFIVQKKRDVEIELSPALEQLALECMPAYETLKQHAFNI